jgi:hypothetical protein
MMYVTYTMPCRSSSFAGDALLSSLPLVEALVDDGLGEAAPDAPHVDPATFTMDKALAMFPTPPQRAAVEKMTLPTSNNPVESGALLEECVAALDEHISQSRDALGRQLQAKLEAQLATVKSDTLRARLRADFGMK